MSRRSSTQAMVISHVQSGNGSWTNSKTTNCVCFYCHVRLPEDFHAEFSTKPQNTHEAIQ